MTKQILFYKPGSLSAKDREKLSRNGFCAVEATDFDAFKVIDASVTADRATILRAAVWAITNAGSASNDGPRTLFGRKLAELLSAKMEKDAS